MVEENEQCYRPNRLSVIVEMTKFNRSEVQNIYRSFKQSAPNGIVDRLKFRSIFLSLFPRGDPSSYADFVFDTFDLDRNGSINFEEFIKSLSVLSRGSFDEKLLWIYRLYDNSNIGYISWERIHALFTSVDQIIGANAQPIMTNEERARRTDEIFAKFDLNKDGRITLPMFLKVCQNDSIMRKSIDELHTIFGI